MPDNPFNSPEEISPEAQGRMEAFFFAHARAGACPPLDLLFAVEEGVLPFTASPGIRAHVADCSLCQIVLAELDPGHAVLTPAADARIRARLQSRVENLPSVTQISSATRRYLFAIAAVLLLGIFSIFGYRLLHSSAEEHVDVAPAPPAPVTRSLPDIAELHHVAPLAPPTDVPALIMRGPSAGHGPTVHDLIAPFRAYNRGDFASAATAFAALEKKFPNSRIPPLYLGVSQLELADTADAQRSLERAYHFTGPSQDAAAWYLALSDLRLDQPKAAAPLLRDLCIQGRSPYKARACTLVRELGPS